MNVTQYLYKPQSYDEIQNFLPVSSKFLKLFMNEMK